MCHCFNQTVIEIHCVSKYNPIRQQHLLPWKNPEMCSPLYTGLFVAAQESEGGVWAWLCLLHLWRCGWSIPGVVFMGYDHCAPSCFFTFLPPAGWFDRTSLTFPRQSGPQHQVDLKHLDDMLLDQVGLWSSWLEEGMSLLQRAADDRRRGWKRTKNKQNRE